MLIKENIPLYKIITIMMMMMMITIIIIITCISSHTEHSASTFTCTFVLQDVLTVIADTIASTEDAVQELGRPTEVNAQ